MSRATAVTLGAVIAGSLIGCAQLGPRPSHGFTVAPEPTPTFTRQPVVGGTTDIVPPSPASRPSPSRRASRSRAAGLPTLLLRIRSCESGPNGYATHGYAFDANYTETNPASTASGAWQFLDSTWAGYGGYSRAMYAPKAVQDAAALKLYAAEGTSPWLASRHCWGA